MSKIIIIIKSLFNVDHVYLQSFITYPNKYLPIIEYYKCHNFINTICIS